MKQILGKKHLSSFQIISLGFSLVILIGTLLLMLPFSTRAVGGAPPADALFTAVSAVCVTGLIVRDTATYWSEFGQLVILCLIQIGGMGVITMVVMVFKISGRKIGLMQRSTMQEAIAAPQMGGIVRLTTFILKLTAGIELAGAALMAPVFCAELGTARGLWYALFHSVSAFCNAGFDLMGVRAPYSSLTSFTAQPVINLVIMTLIIAGGIGFLTWQDILRHRHHLRRYRMQSKVILTASAVLLILPAVFFFFYEFSDPRWTQLTFPERIWGALFQSVAPRTAGFNSLDLSEMSEPSLMLTILLMLIGGSPGSTAGGMKTTTFVVLLASSVTVFFRRGSVQMFKRRISDDTVHYAATNLMMYLTLFSGGGMVICCVEKLPLLQCLFETASAIGTVGLTLGVTPGLGMVSRGILIILMFMGRVGCLTLVFAAISGKHKNVSKLPQDKITVA